MWAIGYVGRLPAVQTRSAVLLGAMLAAVLAGGFVAGRLTGGGWRAGATAATVTSLLNLLILGSLLAGAAPNQLVPSSLWWVPGSLLVCITLGAAGAAFGSRSYSPARPAVDWTAAFAKVAVAATFLLLIVGGLVTSAEAGLAVVDWPNSYGYNMFLYPLARMTGGIYYEHAHRLFGSLVGLTTLGLAFQLRRNEPRGWVRALGYVVFGLVVVQGILGGLRVTGKLTLSSSQLDTQPNLLLALVHGVLAQWIFSLLCSIALFTSRWWKTAAPALSRTAKLDRGLSAALVAVLLVQLALGATLRHLDSALWAHAILGGLLLPLAILVGVRGLDPRREMAPLRRTCFALLGVAHAQVLLGLGALIVTRLLTMHDGPSPASLLLATAHQGMGAVLLGLSVIVALLGARLRITARPTANEAIVGDGRAVNVV